MKNRPAYGLNSVDNALLISLILQQEGAMRLTDIARRLDVAPSTAHRLLQALVYRGFVDQRPDRTYVAGPSLRPLGDIGAATRRLIEASTVLDELVDTVDESVIVTLLVGTEARAVTTIVADRPHAITDRTGSLWPALSTATGRMILSRRSDDELSAYHRGHSAEESARFIDEVAAARHRGFGIQHQDAEDGTVSIGAAVAIPDALGAVGISIAQPVTRFEHRDVSSMVDVLHRSATAYAARILEHAAEPDDGRRHTG